jgi:(S)-3,5-dihydroxyphenylglycine transaminase
MGPIKCTSGSRPGQMEGLTFLNEATYRYPGAVSFVAGRPADRLVSVRACYSWLSELSKYWRAKNKIENGAFWHELGQYSATAGIICEILAKHLECDEGLRVSANSIVVTNGCQEAIFLTLLALFDRDRDVLLVQDPAYVGITGSAAIAGVSIWPIPEDEEVSAFLDFAVDQAAKRNRRIRAIYLVPDHSNPTGSSLSESQRSALLERAYRHDVYVLEDNPYRNICFSAEKIPTLKSLDQAVGGNRVIYLGSFSKCLMPGLRIGYVVADLLRHQASGKTELLANKLGRIKSFVSLTTSPVLQAMVGGLLVKASFSLSTSNEARSAFYRERRDTMLEALEKAFRREAREGAISWSRPEGGFFVRMRVPQNFLMKDALECASNFHVITCPMDLFSLSGSHQKEMRLSYSNTEPTKIRLGVRRLAEYLKKRMNQLPISPGRRSSRPESEWKWGHSLF